ncbi:MAG: diguanylate cyclase [Luteimonas sp.]|nr:diguanylate cyclase [Luteimonas sp.]
MPEFGWQAQWDRGGAAGRQPQDHRARLAEILAQVSREALQADGLQDVLQRIVDCLVRRLPVAIASIILLDDAGQHFVQEVWAGELVLEGFEELPWDVSFGAAGRCARSGKAQLIADVSADPDYVPGNPAVRAEYLVPIRHRDRLHGVLNIESTDEDFFTPAACTVFDAIAHQIAGAIHLARVVAELEAANRKLQLLSTVDGLTGIANRRSFDERLVADCERLSREGGMLSLLLVDADYFKQLNDALGHLQGDECLRRLARICAGFVESDADMAARYGGEELVLLLPGRSSREAAALAERLRRQVEEAAMAHPASIVAPWMTVSIGTCTMLPDNAVRSPARLLSGADRALYAAKMRGRNRVATWDLAANAAEEVGA